MRQSLGFIWLGLFSVLILALAMIIQVNLIALGWAAIFLGLTLFLWPFLWQTGRDALPLNKSSLLILAASHLGVLSISLITVEVLTDPPSLGLVFVALIVFCLKVSLPTAAQLLHIQDHGAQLCGRWLYSSLFLGHIPTARMYYMTPHRGRSRMPLLPHKQERALQFIYRHWLKSNQGAKRAEFLRQKFQKPSLAEHPLAYNWAGGLALVFMCLVLIGPVSALSFLALGALAQILIGLEVYLRHATHKSDNFEQTVRHAFLS